MTSTSANITSIDTGLTSQTETGSNKLKAYELVTRGLDNKLDMKGEHFTKWFEAVSTHAKTMGMNALLEHGPDQTTNSTVQDYYTTNKHFFESYGAMPMDYVQTLSQSICSYIGTTAAITRCMDEN